MHFICVPQEGQVRLNQYLQYLKMGRKKRCTENEPDISLADVPLYNFKDRQHDHVNFNNFIFHIKKPKKKVTILNTVRYESRESYIYLKNSFRSGS